ncbi:MAG TPA: hypothetical protein VGS97_27285 [Actinocrinis sp.]|uniref:hypothetical protein n=1 Tax=Actinocrinis sp. TaxID=1920516 RepID=UPI002DDD7869|nr:hypothetical protein [Actinocrinis sp.]HEV2347823.1 hypothetical protein [Actinocrinis sp.]
MQPTCVEAEDVRLRCAVLREPKAGSSKSEYEDACAVPGDGASAVTGCTVAVADGASESMLAGAWARMLARSVSDAAGRELDAAVFAERVCAAAARWPAYVDRYVRRRERSGRPVAWYEEPKLEQGAYATVLGISFQSESGTVYSGGGAWSAAALGDSCGFQVRDSQLTAAFPLESAAQFDSSPHLAGTRNPDRDLIELRTVTRHGNWLPGDVFYLATDAAAQWFLAEDEADRQPWRQIDEAFDAPGVWLGELRAAHRIRNDDVTIVRCLLEPA